MGVWDDHQISIADEASEINREVVAKSMLLDSLKSLQDGGLLSNELLTGLVDAMPAESVDRITSHCIKIITDTLSIKRDAAKKVFEDAESELQGWEQKLNM